MKLKKKCHKFISLILMILIIISSAFFMTSYHARKSIETDSILSSVNASNFDQDAAAYIDKATSDFPVNIKVGKKVVATKQFQNLKKVYCQYFSEYWLEGNSAKTVSSDEIYEAVGSALNLPSGTLAKVLPPKDIPLSDIFPSVDDVVPDSYAPYLSLILNKNFCYGSLVLMFLALVGLLFAAGIRSCSIFAGIGLFLSGYLVQLFGNLMNQQVASVSDEPLITSFFGTYVASVSETGQQFLYAGLSLIVIGIVLFILFRPKKQTPL